MWSRIRTNRKISFALRSMNAAAGAMLIVGATLPAPAGAAIINTTGAFAVNVTTPAPPTAATGDVRVHVQAGATVNPAVGGFGAVALSNGLAGLGRTKPKFPVVNGLLTPNSDALTNFATATGSITGITTTARGHAEWISSITLLPGGRWRLGATQTANGSVSDNSSYFNPFSGPSGRASAESVDPMSFQTNTVAPIEFEFALGGSSSSPFSIEASPAAYGATGRIEISHSFTGVQLGGQPLSGAMSLVVSSDGPVHDPQDLNVQFTPWAAMGLSPSQVQMVQDYVKTNLSVLPDGSVGIAAGQTLPLIGGSGAPLATLMLDAMPGNYSYSNTLTTTSAVPEPASLGLLAASLLSLGRRRK